MPVEDNELAVTYSLIHSFLTERSHFKAAEAVKKAAKGIIIMKSGGQDGPSLPVIVKHWRGFVADQEKKSMSPTRLTRSESSSSDTDSDSSGMSELTSKGTKAGEIAFAVLPKPKSKGGSPSSESDSSESSSDEESDSESEEDAPIPEAVAVEVDGFNTLAPESRSPTRSSQTLPSIKSSDNSDSDSESSGSSTSVDDSSPASDSDSDSGDTPGSDDTSNTGKKSVKENDKPQNTKVADAPNTPAIYFLQKTDRPTAVTKRRRTDEAGSSVPTSIVRQPKAFNPHRKENGKGQPPKTNTPFSRIKVDEVKFTDERLKDNTFESRKAAINDYGAKASADLIVTRGASFRKEKNKKKRGSYRGGDITMESHSIKFTD